MKTKNHSNAISCFARAMVDGVATTRSFMLSVIRDEDDSDMLERALKRGHAALSMGADVTPVVRDLHVLFS